MSKKVDSCSMERITNYPICLTSRYTGVHTPALRISIPYIRKKASTTGWPPLTRSGLAKLVVTTSTDMPGSMRMPLNCVRDLVVIMNLGIVLFVLVINVVIEYKVSRFPHPAICLFFFFGGEKGGCTRPNPITRLSKQKIAVNLNDEHPN